MSLQPPDVPDLHRTALELAGIADGIAMSYFGGPVPATRKADGSPVTAADREIETALREALSVRRPGDPILGEEEGGTLDPQVPTWVIDPIDATKNFMRGIGVFATLIAVMHRGKPVVGVASMPALGERWDAADGSGARRNGQAVGVSEIGDLVQAHVVHGGLEWFAGDDAAWHLLRDLAQDAWRTRGFGDFWMHLMVAGGMADVAIERDLKIWDMAATACIVVEAGGRFTCWEGGSPFATGDVLASNGLVHGEMLARLARLA